jgi:hypothetical protein
MKKTWIVTGIVVVSLVAATAGIAFAAGRGSGNTRSPAAGQMAAAHDAMHDSMEMQAMHDQMPAALHAKCEAMHEQMDQMMASMMSGSGKMSGPGMMSGSGMMDDDVGITGGSMADHHSSTEG